MKVGTCTVCEENVEEIIPVSDVHTTNVWTYDETSHWQVCACGTEENTDTLGDHVDGDSDSFCDVCGREFVNDTEAELDELLALIEVPTVVDADFTLDDIATWTVKSGTAITLDGANATVTRPTDADATVVLTATVTDGDYSRSKDFTVTVKMQEAAPEPVTVTMSTFTETSAGMDDVISYSTAQGGASTAPAIYSGVIRLYQNSEGGGTITITAKEGYKITSVTIGSGMKTTVAYKVDDNADSAKTDLAAGETISATDISATSVTFTCYGADKNSRLYVNYISVTYEPIAG